MNVCPRLAFYYTLMCMFALLFFFFFMSVSHPWHPTPVVLPGKSHGQRSLVGCSPWGREQSDTSERLRFHFSLSCIGEGNGNPLQCSCLENPRDGGTWWAAVYVVTQSQTRLKWLSSNSHSHPVMSDSVTPWTVVRQSPLIVKFSRPEYWSG